MSTTTKSSVRCLGPSRLAAIVLMVVLLGIALRLLGWDSQSLSNDEVLDLEFSRLPFQELLMAADGFPPLYFLLLKAWNGLAGTEAVARLLSVSLASVALVAMWLYSRAVLPARAAFWPVLLLTFSAYHSWHAQEARVYSLYYLMAILGLWRFCEVRKRPTRKNWLVLSLTCGLGVLVHYYFFFLVTAMFFAQLVPGKTKTTLRSRTSPFLIVGLFCLPSLMVVASDLQMQASLTLTPFSVFAFGYTFFVFIAGYSLGPSIRELHWLEVSDAMHQYLPWLILIGLPVLYLLWMGLTKTESQDRKEIQIQFGLSIAVVLLGALASTLTTVGYKAQYVMTAAPPLLLVLGAGLSVTIKRRLGIASLGILLIVSTISIQNRLRIPRYQTEDIRGACRLLDSVDDKSSPILVTAGYMVDSVDYYLQSAREVIPLPPVNPPSVTLQQVLAALESAVGPSPPRDYWLVYTRGFHGDPDGALKGYLLEQHQLSPIARLAGVEIFKGSID